MLLDAIPRFPDHPIPRSPDERCHPEALAVADDESAFPSLQPTYNFGMALKFIGIEGYRSIRELQLPLKAINVLTGPNGCGKSNLYNGLVLLAHAAKGEFARAIVSEGGTPSIL